MADDVNEVSEGEVSPAKKKGGFPIILVIIIAVVVGAAGFFAGKMLSGGGNTEKKAVEKFDKTQKTDENKKSEDTKTEESSVSSEESGNKEGDSKSDDANKPGLLALDPFTVNLKDPFGRRYAEVILNLEVSKKVLVLKIKNDELLIPKIRDEIFMIISSKSYNELNSTSGKVSLKEEIMMRVNEILNERLGTEPISNVYFTKFLIQ